MTASRQDNEVFEWGATDHLNALETVMWRAEVNPTLSSTVLALEMLDCEPNWDRFYAAHEWATTVVSRFRERVVDGPAGLGQPIWVIDADFALANHVRRVRLPEDATMRDLFDRVRDIAQVPFDRTRPPWQGVLFEGLPDGKAAYALKMHHATLDGMAAVQLLGGMHSTKRAPSGRKATIPLPPPGSTSTLRPVTTQASRDARGLVEAIRTAPQHLFSLKRPDRAAREVASYVASLRRVLGDSGAQPSPLLADRSADWWFGALDVDLGALRAASKVAGASLNDAFISALLGGFRRYHEAYGVAIDVMPIAMPISMRKSEDPAGGNAFAGARFSGQVSETDPTARMHAVGSAVRAARAEPAINGIGAVAPLLARLPGQVIAQLVGNLTKATDLQASNVPGLRTEAYIAGAKVERIYGFGPLPGCAAMVVLVSHGKTCCVAVNLDPSAIKDQQLFGRCLVEGFAEVLGLVPDAPTPVWRG